MLQQVQVCMPARACVRACSCMCMRVGARDHMGDDRQRGTLSAHLVLVCARVSRM